jgi:hypothetical protein
VFFVHFASEIRIIRYAVSTGQGLVRKLMPTFKAHTSYCNQEDPAAASVFDPLITYLYEYQGMIPLRTPPDTRAAPVSAPVRPVTDAGTSRDAGLAR